MIDLLRNVSGQLYSRASYANHCNPFLVQTDGGIVICRMAELSLEIMQALNLGPLPITGS